MVPRQTTETCKYWVQHKRRYCKFEVPRANTDGLCAVHSVGEGDKERIPCPVDPRHMIFRVDTEKHVRKCSLVVDQGYSTNQPFIVPNCNYMLESDPTPSTDVPPRDFLLTVDHLTKSCEEIARRIREIVPDFLLHSPDAPLIGSGHSAISRSLTPLLVRGPDEEGTKHDVQNAAILDTLCSVGLRPSRTTPRLYVELGCGKAGLTRWLMHSIPKHEQDTDTSSVFVLLDYEARRNKAENRTDLQGVVSPESVVRLRLDIKDVDLSQFLVHVDPIESIEDCIEKPGTPAFRVAKLKAKISAIQARPEWPLLETVGTAKHLCGAATDYGFRCLHQLKHKSKVSLVFATCCHHRCDWTQLVGREILVETGAVVSATEFAALCAHAGWATTIGLADEKRYIGRMVKTLIDVSRVYWIAKNFKNIKSVQYGPYIDQSHTPENFAIVVRAH
jgi:tRNA:m4X modification enzyme